MPFWFSDIWLGGVLGGAGSALLAVPIAMVLAGFASRRPGWDAPAPQRPGADRALVAVGLGLVVSLALAGWVHRDFLMLAGLMIPALVFVWTWGAVGWGRATSLAMPIGFIGFALPWEWFLHKSVDLFLQEWTADIAVALLRLAGYPIRYWNDYTFYTWEFYVIVNETCSGMNLLVTLSMTVLVFGWVVQPSVKNRLALMALVFPVTMLANGVRVAVIYLMGHHGDQALAMGPWHYRTAYILFLPVFWFIYVVNNALTRRWARQRQGQPPDGGGGGSPPQSPAG
ncbi:MAG: exosortase/archaeosortase family protein [Myxococcales bacterium]|nr:exosortase/archaeosortase family protein [Myxococcales bacterium]MCB9525859.1 exosortase/archaeosortase family protein [Myxococcales bacterium]